MHHYIGFDLGRDRDHSALAVVTLATHQLPGFDHVHYTKPSRLVLELSFLKRLALGTPYLGVLEQLKRLLRNLKNDAAGTARTTCTLVIDSAAPGQGAVGLIRKGQLSIGLLPLVITAGGAPSMLHGGRYGVPRRQLIANLG